MKKALTQDKGKETNVIGKLTDAGLYGNFAKAVAELDELKIKSILTSIQISDDQIDWWVHYCLTIPSV